MPPTSPFSTSQLQVIPSPFLLIFFGTQTFSQHSFSHYRPPACLLSQLLPQPQSATHQCRRRRTPRSQSRLGAGRVEPPTSWRLLWGDRCSSRCGSRYSSPQLNAKLHCLRKLNVFLTDYPKCAMVIFCLFKSIFTLTRESLLDQFDSFLRSLNCSTVR